ncbi:Carboxypeptidase E [Orchesella cincta]|uniref:Carboxypeptidase E n=1 Tax=Orchesella cincta TaxID=48709 RepID=A0A1D2NM88_ORCCI|nr:Carboxypeptidase E [Orchesella cincta]
MAWNLGIFSPFLILLSYSISVTASTSFQFKHHNNQEILKVLESVHQACPNVTRIYTLSETSVKGVPLYMIEFSTHPGQHEILKPEFKYIGNMHGNEVLGRELLLKLADQLCQGYRAQDPVIQPLVQKTRIHILPSMNPDGWDLATRRGKNDYLVGRSNANGIDLNRDFPDLDRIMFGNEAFHVTNNNHLMDQVQTLDHPIQPETLAVMRLIMSTPFVLSANLHGGDLVVNYPYDSSRSGADSEYTETPDDDTFRYISTAYSRLHPTMGDPSREPCDKLDAMNFGKSGGIVNGAKWYSVRGGMQDFNYLSSNDFEITLELGCRKYTKEQDLEKEWNDNKDALINFMWQTHIGVKGLVRDSITGRAIANAAIRVRNITQINQTHAENYEIDHDITSVFDGDYFRLLTTGEYLVTAVHAGYKSQTRRVKVTNLPKTEAARLDFWLEPTNEVQPNQLGDFFEEPAELDELGANEPGPPRQTRQFSELTVDEMQPEVENVPLNTDSETPSRDWIYKWMYGHLGNV